jgi:excisionase family DNA binding protein
LRFFNNYVIIFLDFSFTNCKGEILLTNAVKEEKPQTPDSVSELLTVREVAQMLRVDDTTVRRWVKNGVLEAVSLTHVNLRQAYRIKKATVEKLFNQELNTAQTEVPRE